MSEIASYSKLAWALKAPPPPALGPRIGLQIIFYTGKAGSSPLPPPPPPLPAVSIANRGGKEKTQEQEQA